MIELKILSLVPTRAGCAIFLGTDDKAAQFFIDNSTGQAINDHLAQEVFDRPMTFDVMTSLLTNLGAKMQSLIIVDYKEGDEEDGIYYANMVWEVQNEVQHRKIIELDCRPSDGIALAVRQNVPVMITPEVWDRIEDKTSLLDDIKGQAEGEF